MPLWLSLQNRFKILPYPATWSRHIIPSTSIWIIMLASYQFLFSHLSSYTVFVTQKLEQYFSNVSHICSTPSNDFLFYKDLCNPNPRSLSGPLRSYPICPWNSLSSTTFASFWPFLLCSSHNDWLVLNTAQIFLHLCLCTGYSLFQMLSLNFGYDSFPHLNYIFAHISIYSRRLPRFYINRSTSWCITFYVQSLAYILHST